MEINQILQIAIEMKLIEPKVGVGEFWKIAKIFDRRHEVLEKRKSLAVWIAAGMQLY